MIYDVFHRDYYLFFASSVDANECIYLSGKDICVYLSVLRSTTINGTEITLNFYSTTLLEPYRNSSRSDVRQGAILETVRKQRA